MSNDLGSILNSINDTKVNLFDQTDSPIAFEKLYQPFIVNRCLSAHQDLILLVNELNIRGGPKFGMTKRAHYEFLLHAVPRRKRFAKLPKAIADERVEIVKQLNRAHSNDKARAVANLLTDQQFKELQSKLIEGGSNRA